MPPEIISGTPPGGLAPRSGNACPTGLALPLNRMRDARHCPLSTCLSQGRLCVRKARPNACLTWYQGQLHYNDDGLVPPDAEKRAWAGSGRVAVSRLGIFGKPHRHSSPQLPRPQNGEVAVDDLKSLPGLKARFVTLPSSQPPPG